VNLALRQLFSYNRSYDFPMIQECTTMLRLCLALTVIFLGVYACGDDDKEESKGEAIGAPQVTPPVKRNVPAGVGSSLQGESEFNTPVKRMVNTIQTYLNPSQADAIGALDRLEKIDERMAELDMRAQDGPQKVCLKEDAKAYTLAAALPGTDTFAMMMQCQENLDGGDGSAKGAQLAFGLTTTDLWLFERTGAHTNAVLARATLDETTTEFWQLSSNEGNSYIHLIAEDGKGMEFTTAGTGTGSMDCGIHMKSNTNFVYAVGKDSVGGACSDDDVEICLAAADLSEAEVTDCTGAGLNTFTLTTLTKVAAEAAGTNAETIILTPITGMTEFNVGEEDE
jgi:hypothetical protein